MKEIHARDLEPLRALCQTTPSSSHQRGGKDLMEYGKGAESLKAEG